MEAIIRTENKTLFDALLHFLRTLNITVEPKEKEVRTLKKTKKGGQDLNDIYFTMKKLRGSGNGKLIKALLEERTKDKYR